MRMSLCPSLPVFLMLHRSTTLPRDPQWAFLECRFQLIKFSGICFAHEVTEGATIVQASAEDLSQLLLIHGFV